MAPEGRLSKAHYLTLKSFANDSSYVYLDKIAYNAGYHLSFAGLSKSIIASGTT